MLLAFVALAACSAGAVAYAFLFNRLQTEKNVEKRLDTVKKADTDRAAVKASRDRIAEVAKRRKSVQDSLKELDDRQKARNLNLKKPPLRRTSPSSIASSSCRFSSSGEGSRASSEHIVGNRSKGITDSEGWLDALSHVPGVARLHFRRVAQEDVRLRRVRLREVWRQQASTALTQGGTAPPAGQPGASTEDGTSPASVLRRGLRRTGRGWGSYKT